MFETSKIPRKDNPRETANVFSLLTFLYSAEIFKKSKHRELEEDDIYNVVTNCRSDSLGDALEKRWKLEVISGRKSLTRVIRSLFGWEYAYYGFLNLIIQTPLAAITPYATGILVSYFETSSNTTQGKAILCGSILIGCSVLSAVYKNYYNVVMNRLGLQIEISLCALVYRKALKLTPKSLCEVTSGRIVTLITQDSLTACAASILFLHDLWIGVVQVVIILGIMYHRIGASTLVGIGFFMAVIPLQVWIGLKVKQIYLKTFALTDERLRRIQEILTSIRLIKLYCWENYFSRIVRTLRKKEMFQARNTYFLRATMQSISSLSYRVSYFLCVLAYYVLGSNISAEELFFLVTCYKSLDGLLSDAIPGSMVALARGKSALKRIKLFLLTGEINDDEASLPGQQKGDCFEECKLNRELNTLTKQGTQVGAKGDRNRKGNQSLLFDAHEMDTLIDSQKISEYENVPTVEKETEEEIKEHENESGNESLLVNSEGFKSMERKTNRLEKEYKSAIMEDGECNMKNQIDKDEIKNCYSNKHTRTIEGINTSFTSDELVVQQENTKQIKTQEACANINLNNVTLNIMDKLLFKDVTFELSQPSLIGITGSVGIGKTTFLKALINDVEVTEGDVCTTGAISYASQEPWLFPGTIRQNILFGNTYNHARYIRVLKVCALLKDLNGFPAHDQTVVTDKGLNLSRGQQARINLARAVYRKADIYCFDDVLSSLDSKVSKYVFANCIRGFLKGKLRLLVCHNSDFLSLTDKTLSLIAGGIQVNDNHKVVGVMEDQACDDIVEDTKFIEMQGSHVKLYKEHKVAGKVEWKDYKACFDLAGGWMVISLVVGICLATQFIAMVFDYYANQWLDIEAKVIESLHGNKTLNDLTTSNVSRLSFELETGVTSELALERRTVLHFYAGILAVLIAFIFIEYFTFFAMTVRATRNMHIVVFERIMGATMNFFDKNFSGSILNRLSKDMALVDEVLGSIYFGSIKTSFELAVIVALIVYLNPILCAPAFIFLMIVLYAGVRFLRSSRSLRRMEPIVRAPCIGYLNASLEGLTTIRATGNQKLLIEQFDAHQDHYSSVVYMMFMSKHAFGLWLDLLGAVFSLCIIFSFIIFHHKIENIAGNVGVAVTQAIGISSLLQSCVLLWSEVENSMTAAERVLEYGDAEQEKTTGESPTTWPQETKIEYKSVSLKYPNSDSKILHDINFTIAPGQKIGIVGRTGAGKSSIISALFRLYQPEGTISINDRDTSLIKLKTLRSKISIIPQDPILFKGTVRSNLDPEDLYTDMQIWNALEKVGLKNAVTTIGLSYTVQEGGLNFSIGQRQLFSLARVVLSNNKIVVFDEATANMDPDTDCVIQKVINELFVECTVITIAHRMNTVIGCDVIMVVDGGKIVELGRPQELLERKSSYFNSVMK